MRRRQEGKARDMSGGYDHHQTIPVCPELCACTALVMPACAVMASRTCCRHSADPFVDTVRVCLRPHSLVTAVHNKGVHVDAQRI